MFTKLVKAGDEHSDLLRQGISMKREWFKMSSTLEVRRSKNFTLYKYVRDVQNIKSYDDNHDFIRCWMIPKLKAVGKKLRDNVVYVSTRTSFGLKLKTKKVGGNKIMPASTSFRHQSLCEEMNVRLRKKKGSVP